MRIELSGRHPFLRAELSVHDRAADRAVVLDARRLQFAGPLELAAMVTLATTAAHGGADVTFLMPESDDVASYIQRMNVVEYIEPIATITGALATQRRNDCSQRLLEVTAVSPANGNEVAATLGRMTEDQLHPRAASAAFRSIGELIDNATTHGESPLGAFAAAQLYSGATSRRAGFEFAICDTGVGVLEHLRTNSLYEKVADHKTALDLALRYGVTGALEGRGHGLTDLREQARRDGVGRLILRSGDAIASVVVRRNRTVTCETVGTPISGTWAWLRVRVP
ncbi:hypothetical protein ACFFMM_00520 [Micromonospora chaiyaphumensis]|uniref:Uncharacterized protein n=1 Tax=Micromonospora chaiyaphumensis TaxID=307119 RepID=A0A1C4ZMZ9_9ACTN|nr:hypothetical protein [Micromonospora chaiyaphumensis]SCF34161.1 hypothetical protein GA0070214_11781 [Micromonospora chaiyaphumensis]